MLGRKKVDGTQQDARKGAAETTSAKVDGVREAKMKHIRGTRPLGVAWMLAWFDPPHPSPEMFWSNDATGWPWPPIRTLRV